MGPDQINTIAAATVQALTTQMAPPPATATPLPTIAPTATATLAVPTLNLTVIPTLSLATSTLIPLPTTAGSSECNRATFISETVADGTVVKPGAAFEKSWKIRNDGNCTWTSAYSSAVFSNDPSSPVITGDGSFPLPASVVPGGMVTILVKLIAPKEEGTYTQVWKMQDADEKSFGQSGGGGWWVTIKVSKTGAVTPSSVSSSIALSGEDFTGTITTSKATSVTWNWQIYGTGWSNLTAKKTETFNGAGISVDSYTGGFGAACTAAGLASGSDSSFRLNLNEYGYSTKVDFVCP